MLTVDVLGVPAGAVAVTLVGVSAEPDPIVTRTFVTAQFEVELTSGNSTPVTFDPNKSTAMVAIIVEFDPGVILPLAYVSVTFGVV